MVTWTRTPPALASLLAALSLACSSAEIPRSGVEDAAAPSPSGDSGAARDGSSGDPTRDAGTPDRDADDAAADGRAHAGALAPGTSTLTVSVAGLSRSVVLVVPSAAATSAVPLVVALHGNGDSNTNFVRTAGLATLAERRGFVLAAPQGVRQDLNVQGQTIPGVDWDAYRTIAEGNVDLPLVESIRARLASSGSVDPRRIVVFGYSQGGYLSFRVAMEAADRVACGAVLAASSPLGPQLVARASRKVAVALQIGTNDYGYQGALDTKAALESSGFPVFWHAVQGAGHVPLPGDPAVPLDECLAQRLP